MNMQKLPVGIDNFEKLRQEDFYYVDKSGMIIELMQNWGEVNLFTRPRRFGKTLNMSMLKYFFEIGGDKHIFDGLKVTQDQQLCETYMGKYPVIFVSLKGVDGLNYQDAYVRFCEIIRREARRHQYLLSSEKLSDVDIAPFERIFEDPCEPGIMTSSLATMTNLLCKHHGQKAILLIDEYDVPLDKAYAHDYYPQMIDLIRSMFGAALKTNDSLFFAVLTGCMRVSKESIFTGLNNLKVHGISNPGYDEYFGFTDEEVRQMLTAYGLEAHYEETRAWYDGYLFGENHVYCPWDVINYCYDLRTSERAKPQAYWLNTSGNDMVRKLISLDGDGSTQMELEQLIAGETISKTLNENLTHNEIDRSVENIWSLLYMTGYLTITKEPENDCYTLKIPNREIRKVYVKQVLSWFREKAKAESANLSKLYEAFEQGDTETITEYLNEQLLNTVSFYDAHESFYHGFLLALLNTCADWRVASNAETGKGRCDIIVERRDRKLGFVVEVKDVKDEDKLDAACENAMKQIEEKDYTAILRRYRFREIWTYGIAFWDKECRVVAKKER